jgi:hypothetical protein
VRVCADTKCKIETTEIGTDSIKYSLGEARKQLSSDCPGIVFVKVPQHWIDDARFRDSLIAAADVFCAERGGSFRLNSTFLHLCSPDNMIAHLMRYKEISNPRNRFDSERNWDLFSDHDVPSGSNGMPPHWLRLIYFPDAPVARRELTASAT